MSRIEHETDINAPVEREFMNTIQIQTISKKHGQEVVKESESTTPSKNEPGSEMKVKGEYMGRKAEMRLEVAEKEPNRKLVTRQTEGPFKRWESVQEFQGDNNRTHIRHVVDYELG